MEEGPPLLEVGRKVLRAGCTKGQPYVGRACHAWVFPKRRRGSPEPLRGGVFLVVSCSVLSAWFLALYMGFGIRFQEVKAIS